MFALPTSKSLSRRVALVIIVGLAITIGLIFYFGQKSPVSTSVTTTPATLSTSSEPAQTGLPVRLKIPKISIDIPIEQVGITSEGDMDIPKGRINAGWYNKGPRPGQTGSSVITAHYGWRGGKPAAFDDLHQLRKGDKVYVKDDKGKTVTFIVRASRQYNPEADASSVFKSRDGKSHLNLVTCEGSWDKDQKSYSDRRVVFADREER